MDNMILFWTAFGAIGQALGAIATAGAVIITLWQIRHATDKKLRLSFSDNQMILTDRGVAARFVGLFATNVGNRNVVIISWGIKISRKQNFLIVPDMENPLYALIQKNLPFTIEPEQSLNLVQEISIFTKNLKSQVQSGVLKNKQRLIFYVTDSTGKEYRLNSRKTIRRFLKENSSYLE